MVPLDTYVAGTFAYHAKEVCRHLLPGDRLKLRLEPSNRFDHWAIEVLTADDVKLGYVPRAINKPFVELMEKGHEVHAEVIAIEPDQYEDIEIRLKPID